MALLKEQWVGDGETLYIRQQSAPRSAPPFPGGVRYVEDFITARSYTLIIHDKMIAFKNMSRILKNKSIQNSSRSYL